MHPDPPHDNTSFVLILRCIQEIVLHTLELIQIKPSYLIVWHVHNVMVTLNRLSEEEQPVPHGSSHSFHNGEKKTAHVRCFRLQSLRASFSSKVMNHVTLTILQGRECFHYHHQPL